MPSYAVFPLTKEKFSEAVKVVLDAELDSRKEVEHHLQDLDAHYYVADEQSNVIGVIGWYQDTVNYANEAMGDKFPGEKAYWVGFFAVEKKYRGQGTGHALITKLQEVLLKKGISELWVSSVPETVNYYQRQGFQKVMEGKIAGSPKIFMVKRW